MGDLKKFSRIASKYEFFHYGAKDTISKLEQISSFGKEDKVLDIGGGTGRIAEKLSGITGEVTVIDPSEGMIKECKNKVGIKCVVGGAELLPFDESSFDKIIIVDAFHHFDDFDKVIREIKRVLKPNGKAILVEIHPKKAFGRIAKISEYLFGFHNRFFLPADLARLWEDNGYKSSLFYENKGEYYLLAEKL